MNEEQRYLIGTFVLDVFYVDMETQEIVHAGEIVPVRFDDKNFPTPFARPTLGGVDILYIQDALHNKPSGQMVLFEKNRAIGMLYLLNTLNLYYKYNSLDIPIWKSWAGSYELDENHRNYGLYYDRHRAYLNLITAWKKRHAIDTSLSEIVASQMYKDTIVPAFAWQKPS